MTTEAHQIITKSRYMKFGSGYGPAHRQCDDQGELVTAKEGTTLEEAKEILGGIRLKSSHSGR